MITKQHKVHQYIVSFYGLLHFIMFILPLAKGGEEIAHMDTLEKSTVALAFIVFATGAIISWFHEKWGGLIISFWHVLVWAFALLIWTDAAMVLILIFPMIFPASLLITNWYKKNTDRYSSSYEKQKLGLQVILSNYGAVYLLIVLQDILQRFTDWGTGDMASWGFASPLGLMVLGLFIVFIIAFILSWKTNLIPGLMLIFCFLWILFLTFNYPEFANSGPWSVFSLVFLIHGILYLFLFFQEEKLKN